MSVSTVNKPAGESRDAHAQTDAHGQPHVDADAGADAEAIAAIQGGDLERYRDLIARYERRVYAVAWARLGDASLAEEAVQESFIRAYRHLGWLRDPARFGGWLVRITRGIAINLGLRHRRELKRRERWALDSATDSAGSAGTLSGPLLPTETLRDVLAALPARHRECLVLHYLEGHSIARAAAMLEISEGAFKVRLHRARAALRKRLAARFEESLERLQPQHSMAPTIMAALPGVAPAGVGGGIFAGLGAALSKILPGPWLLALFPAFSALLSLVAVSWVFREERRNFKDADGFRVELHRRAVRRNLLGVVSMLAIVAFAFSRFGTQLGGVIGPFLLFAVLVVFWVAGLRMIQLNRNPALILQCVINLVVGLVFMASTVIELPFWAIAMMPAVFLITTAFSISAQPRRHDYNLFLRRWKEMIRPQDHSPAPAAVERRKVLKFGRLLGTEWLLCAYRRAARGYVFGLMPVEPHFWHQVVPILWRDLSVVRIDTEGHIAVALGPGDARALRRMGAEPDVARAAWERILAIAVAHSLADFLEGKPDLALQRLGQSPVGEVFRVPPGQSRAVRVQRAWMIGAGLLFMLWMGVFAFKGGGKSRPGRPKLPPVAITLHEAQAPFQALNLSSDASSRGAWRLIYEGLAGGVFLPPPGWFQPEGLARIRRNLLGDSFEVRDAVVQNAERILGTPALLRAVHFGWITTNDLAGHGITSAAIREAVEAWPARSRAWMLGLEEVSIQNRDYSRVDTESLLWRCRLLHRIGLMDLVDAGPVVAQLCAHQVLPGRKLPDSRRADLDTQAWHGLFATTGWNPISETYHALAILALLGGVDAVDREACIEGILRFHRGKGRFGADVPWEEIQLLGDARDTFHALESLRVLGALDRVADLAAWEFRPLWTSSREGSGAMNWKPTWREIEAAVLKERHTRSPSDRDPDPGPN